MSYQSDIQKVLVSEEELDRTVARISKEIAEDAEKSDKKLLLVGVLKGAVVFMSDILKKLNIPLETDFVKVSSYGSGTTSSGKIRLKAQPDHTDLSMYHVVVIEDIVDTGNTLSWLLDYLKNELHAQDVKLCALFNKPACRKKDVKIDYQGFVIPDEFIVGYGLDYAEQYRNLPYVGILKPEVYENR